MSAPVEPVVQIDKLWSVFRSAGQQAVIHKDIDLVIGAGELLSIVGGSGSGKTVLLRQILGLETPAQGSVMVLGKPAAELGDAGAASRVGMLFQHGALYSAFTVLENAMSVMVRCVPPLWRSSRMQAWMRWRWM